MRHAMQRGQVRVIQSVPRVHLQAERVRLFRAGNQPLQFGKIGGARLRRAHIFGDFLESGLDRVSPHRV